MLIESSNREEKKATVQTIANSTIIQAINDMHLTRSMSKEGIKRIQMNKNEEEWHRAYLDRKIS